MRSNIDTTGAIRRRESAPQSVNIAVVEASAFVPPDEKLDEDSDDLDSVSNSPIKGDEVIWTKDDPDHPHNWSPRRKWTVVAVVSVVSFLSPLNSTLISPAMGSISEDLGYSSDILSSMAIVVFVLGYAIGPVFISPLSETYGRSPLYKIGNIVWAIMTVISARSTNIGMLIAFRFAAGLCGAIPMTLFGGTVHDLFIPQERGRATGLIISGSLTAPAIGPVAAALMVGADIQWHWLLDGSAIVIAIFALASFFLLHETYPPKLLEKRRKRLAAETGRDSLYTTAGRQVHGREFWIATLTRPIILLFTKPACFAVSLFQAFNYAVLYVLYATIPAIWQSYGFSVQIVGVLYIPLALGAIVALVILTYGVDRIYKGLTKRNNGVAEPEFKLPLALAGGLLTPAGLLLFGWPAQYHVHWFVPSLGLGIFSGGVLFPFLCTTTYLIDSFSYAASAVAAAIIFRSLAGFVLPLFGQKLFDALGVGWGCTLLAGLSLAIGLPVPVLLYVYGKQLRTGEPRGRGVLSVPRTSSSATMVGEEGAKQGTAVGGEKGTSAGLEEKVDGR